MKRGELIAVGTGIKSIAHVTTEGRNAIKSADKVLYILADFLSTEWINGLNSQAENMKFFYEDGKHRAISYCEMNEYTLGFVRQGLKVCVVYYGHPGVFCAPAHMSVLQAREEGYAAQMLPGISAEDCLFSDLNVDPAHGCQSFEATNFLLYRRQFDPSCMVILWQIGVIGNLDFRLHGYEYKRGLRVLINQLLTIYPADHPVTVYEAATYEVCQPVIFPTTLFQLIDAPITSVSTLYIPPYLANFRGADPVMIEALAIDPQLVLYQPVDELVDVS